MARQRSRAQSTRQVSAIGDRIAREVASWPGVEVSPHRFGGVEFRLARQELGHLHGEELADLPFPVAVRHALVDEGRAEPHHLLPQTGWVSRRIRRDEDVEGVIALFRLNYERIAGAVARREAAAATED